LIGAEPHPPYNRPPLSKSVLTGDDATPWQRRIGRPRQLPGRSAVALETTGRTIALDDGTHVPYDGLVIATGAAHTTLVVIP
jgi:NADPH-dependent 2,4-dienoyl-CoA reductase/sulfur reductase-like enzyme